MLRDVFTAFINSLQITLQAAEFLFGHWNCCAINSIATHSCSDKFSLTYNIVPLIVIAYKDSVDITVIICLT